MAEKSLLFVVGARPNFVKLAPVCKALKERGDLPFRIVHTGQHYDANMSDVFFRELNIPAPDFYLKVGSGSHARQTGGVMIKLEELCREHFFSGIAVIGDVNSTLAAALVGAKMGIPVAHIESGLRSFNRAMPEEINRIATDHISDLLFAPSHLAMKNLEREGLSGRAVFSGDVMYDIILEYIKRIGNRSALFEKQGIAPGNYYIATLHRPYNVDEPSQLKEIIAGLSQLEKPVILPAHPRLKKNLHTFGIKMNGNIRLIPPTGYLDFIVLQKHAAKVITDSGGVQKEAFFVETCCVTLRPETEWEETVALNANVLVKERTAQAILDAVGSNNKPDFSVRPYGEGNASEIITRAFQAKLQT